MNTLTKFIAIFAAILYIYLIKGIYDVIYLNYK